MYSKKKRTVDRATVEFVRDRRDGRCMAGIAGYGPCSAGKDPHHITSRGAGGGDIPENLITLCRKHHREAHAAKISKDELRAILTKYYGYNYDGVY